MSGGYIPTKPHCHTNYTSAARTTSSQETKKPPFEGGL